MSIHGCSHAEYAEKFSRVSLQDADYLAIRDLPEMLRKYVKGDVVLDYGCGPGKSLGYLKKLGFSADGVDINESMINQARKAMPESKVQLLQGGKILAEDGSYDFVFCSWVLQEVGSRDKLTAALSEISRVLKSDGTFVAIVPSEAFYTKDWIHANAAFEENKRLKSGDQALISVKGGNFFWRDHFWTENDYRDMMRGAGLDVILVHYPLGRDEDGIAWLNEKETSPVTIFVAKKKTCDN